MSEPYFAWIIDSFFHWYWAQLKSHLTKDNIKKSFCFGWFWINSNICEAQWKRTVLYDYLVFHTENWGLR